VEVGEGVGLLVVASGTRAEGEEDTTGEGEVLFEDVPVGVADVGGGVVGTSVAVVGVSSEGPVPGRDGVGFAVGEMVGSVTLPEVLRSYSFGIP
jgi:hypothetical protein